MNSDRHRDAFSYAQMGSISGSFDHDRYYEKMLNGDGMIRVMRAEPWMASGAPVAEFKGPVSMTATMEEVKKDPLHPWSRMLLSLNPNITLEIVDNVNLPNATGKWDWEMLSMHVPVSDITNNLHRSWAMIGEYRLPISL